MVITNITQQVLPGVYKITPEAGPAFFIRPEYLKSINLTSLEIGSEFLNAQEEELLDAALVYAVEIKAMDYLSRAEQSCFGLTRKLLDKGFDKVYIDACLEYLKSIGYLSDERYARSWLNTRKLNHYEGQTKLIAELQKRGISRNVAKEVVQDFFLENKEDEFCRKAIEKLRRTKKSEDKLVASLLNAGFSYKMIQENLHS